MNKLNKKELVKIIIENFTDKKGNINISNLDLSHYKILHVDNPQSKQYLWKLINEGYLSFGISEHWKKSKKDNGARGAAIAKSIGHEINRLFDDLWLPRPVYRVNFGQRSIEIDDDTAEVLRQIREIV